MKKKVSLVICIFIVALSPALASNEPVELVAPRAIPSFNVKFGPTINTIESEKSINMKTKPKVSSKIKVKSTKKRVHIRKRIINYNKISKLIEYNHFNEADSATNAIIKKNPKDIKAWSLRLISLAKQRKLKPAQTKLNQLLKKYPKNSNLHYAQGVVYYQRTTSSNMFYRNDSKKYIKKAMSEFKKAIELDKTNARALNAAGVVALHMNKTEEARRYFNQALSADKTCAVAIDNLGTMDFRDKKFGNAEKKFKESLKYNTQNTTAMYHLAQIYFQNKDYASALNYLNDALAIIKESPSIYNLMGKAYVKQGNQAAAINAFKNSINIKPEFTLSYLDLANIYQKRGDSEFAIEQLKTALSITPDYYDAKLKIADISLNNEKYKQAIPVYSELIGVDGYNDLALKGLANAYYGQAQKTSQKALLGSNKELFKALNYINKAIETNGNDLELYLAKLKLSSITNQPKQTQIVLNKIIQSPTNNLTSMITKGEAYLALNDYKNAQIFFNSAIDLSKNEQENSYLREILMYLKQYDNAEKIIKKTLTSEPQNQEALSCLDYIQKSKKHSYKYYKSAKSFAKSRKTDVAILYLSRSLDIDPNNAKAHLLLAQLYEKQKDYPNSISNYKAFLSLEPNSKNSVKVLKKLKYMGARL